MKFTWPVDNQNRLTMMGKFDHAREINMHGEIRSKQGGPEIDEQIKKYRQMEQWTVKAPSRTKKKAEKAD